MNIAYLTTDNPFDIHGWSGLTYNIAQSLIEAGNHLDYIHSFSSKTGIILKIKQKLYPKFTGKFIQLNRHREIYGQYPAQILPQLEKLKNINFIFSNSSETIAALKTDIPMAYWADACFAGMLGYYTEFSKIHEESIKEANILEQTALNNAKYVFFSSEWAAKTAIDNYTVDPKKIFVVPFGANVNHNYQINEIQNFINLKNKDVCKLLFIGVDWERKGGDIALKTAETLIKAGIKTELIIVGTKASFKFGKPDYVREIGFLSKKNPQDQLQLDELFKESHFLLVPSQAECYGLVYCEANSYGLPALGTNTGGIPTIIQNGINGFAFDINCAVENYVAFITKYFNDKKLYSELAINSFNEYQSRLNWKVAGKSIMNILRK